jgi:hypothetical protein
MENDYNPHDAASLESSLGDTSATSICHGLNQP